MAAVSSIEITTSMSEEVVRDKLASAFGTRVTRRDDDNRWFLTAFGVGMYLDRDPVDASASYALAIYGENVRAVFDALADATSWGLAAYDVGAGLVAQRPALAHSA